MIKEIKTFYLLKHFHPTAYYLKEEPPMMSNRDKMFWCDYGFRGDGLVEVYYWVRRQYRRRYGSV